MYMQPLDPQRLLILANLSMVLGVLLLVLVSPTPTYSMLILYWAPSSQATRW